MPRCVCVRALARLLSQSYTDVVDALCAWLQNFERFKETKRTLLREKQAREVAELEEKLMEKRYILMRTNESHRKTYVSFVYIPLEMRCARVASSLI